MPKGLAATNRPDSWTRPDPSRPYEMPPGASGPART